MLHIGRPCYIFLRVICKDDVGIRSNSGRMNVVVVAVHTIERQLAWKVLNDLFHHSTNFRDAVVNYSSGSKGILSPQGPRSLREHVLRGMKSKHPP